MTFYWIAFSLFIIEIIILCCGGTIFAYHTDRKISESISIGIILATILISLIFQIAFLLETPQIAVLIEAVLCIVTARYIFKRQYIIKIALSSIYQFALKHKLITAIVAICWLYLLALVVFIPPANWDSMAYNLARIFLFEQEQSFYLENFNTIRQKMFVVGADILNYGFLRLNKDYGVGLFSWLSYISVGLGTYGLSRRFANTKVSIATTLVIISLTEFCFQATSTKNDIFTAAAAVFCFVTGDRFLSKPEVKTLAMLLLGIAFGFSTKTTFVAFLVPFVFCFFILTLFKVGWKTCYQIVTHNWLYFTVLVTPILIISQFWLFLDNQVSGGDVTGVKTIKIVRNNNILLGGTANLIRYLLQSFHLFPIDYALKGRLGIDIGGFVTKIYNQLFFPIFGDSGIGTAIDSPYVFRVTVLPYEDFSWYGPLAFFIILPAIIFTLIKGHYWLKVQALCLISFIMVVSYKLHWTPWSNRYLSLFFVASGVCVAFFLQNLSCKYQSQILQGITSIALILLISACVLNTSKPLGGLSITEFFKPNIWSKTELGSDRLYYGNKHYRDNRLEKFRDLVPTGSRVALLANKKSWIYHFYLVKPQSQITPLSVNKLKSSIENYDYVLCLDVACDPAKFSGNYTQIWESPQSNARSAKIIKLLNK